MPPFSSLLVALALGALSPVAAQEVATVAKPAADFTKAFGLLRDLGLPSVKDAQPRMPAGYQPENVWGRLEYYYWEKTGPNGGQVVVTPQLVEVNWSNKSQRSPQDKMRMEYQQRMTASATQANNSVGSGAIEACLAIQGMVEYHRLKTARPEVDVGADLVKAARGFTDEDFRGFWVDRTQRRLAQALIFAAALDERGHKDQANRLAEAVLTTRLGSEFVISGAVTLLAEAEYAKAYVRFFASRDLKAWKVDLDALLAKFPRGYMNTAAVQLAADSATRALAATPLANPEAEAIVKLWRSTGMDEATRGHLESAKMMAEDASSRAYRLAVSEQNGTGEDVKKPLCPWILDAGLAGSGDPLGKLLAMGLDAIPILESLAADSSATCITTAEIAYGSGSHNDNGRSAAAASALHHYRIGMLRPATVGEVAALLLAAAIPVPEETKRPASSEEWAECAVAWADGLPARTREAVAMSLFTSGSTTQKEVALWLLLLAPTAEQIKQIETHLIELRPRHRGIDQISGYLHRRGAEAAGFFDRYHRAMKEEVTVGITAGSSDYFSKEWGVWADDEAKSKKQAMAMLRPLEAFVRQVDIAKLIVDFAEADAGRNQNLGGNLVMLGSLRPVLATLPPAEVNARWLAAMAQAKKPEVRRQLMGFGPYVLKPIPLDEASRSGWRALIADEANYFTKEERERYGSSKMDNLTIGQVVLKLFICNQDQLVVNSARYAGLTDVLGDQGINEIMNVSIRPANLWSRLRGGLRPRLLSGGLGSAPGAF